MHAVFPAAADLPLAAEAGADDGGSPADVGVGGGRRRGAEEQGGRLRPHRRVGRPAGHHGEISFDRNISLLLTVE